MSVTLIIIIVVCVGFAAWQSAVWISEIQHKNRKCCAAVEISRKLNKPMLVAGGPWGGHSLRRRFNLPAHTKGDVCIDINPNAIFDYPNSIVANVICLPFSDKTFGSVFASHLLEHLPDIASARQALMELNRVAEVVFIAYPSRQSVAAWLIRDHHLWVWQNDNTTYLKQRGNAGSKEKEASYNLISNPSK